VSPAGEHSPTSFVLGHVPFEHIRPLQDIPGGMIGVVDDCILQINRPPFLWTPSARTRASTQEGGQGKETGVKAPTRTHGRTARAPRAMERATEAGSRAPPLARRTVVRRDVGSKALSGFPSLTLGRRGSRLRRQ